MRLVAIVTLLSIAGWMGVAQAQQQDQQKQQAQQAQQQAEEAQRQAQEARQKAQEAQQGAQQDQQRQQAQEAQQGAQQRAQQEQQRQQQRGQQGSFGQGGTGQQPLIMSQNEQLIEGQVVDDKNVEMQAGKDHRIVQLKMKNGQTIHVDLGTKDSLPSGFDIRKGQWVLVAGIQGQLGNQQVFVAHRWANVFNLAASGGAPSSPTEKLPGQREGEGGSKADDSDYKAHYRDYGTGDYGRVDDSGTSGQDKSRDRD